MDVLAKKSGFTIVELAIVLVLIGIIAAMVVVLWPGKKLLFNAQAELLASDIRYTQSLSMSKSERYKLIKTSVNSYQIQDSAGTPIVLPSGNTTVVFAANITFGTFVNLPNDLIAFNSKGVPYVDIASPGTPLIAIATVPLVYKGFTHNISISPETGRVTL